MPSLLGFERKLYKGNSLYWLNISFIKEDIAFDVDRAVFALQYEDIRGIDVYDIISGIFPDNGKDFVIDLDNNTIAIVKEVKMGTEASELDSRKSFRLGLSL